MAAVGGLSVAVMAAPQLRQVVSPGPASVPHAEQNAIADSHLLGVRKPRFVPGPIDHGSLHGGQLYGLRISSEVRDPVERRDASLCGSAAHTPARQFVSTKVPWLCRLSPSGPSAGVLCRRAEFRRYFAQPQRVTRRGEAGGDKRGRVQGDCVIRMRFGEIHPRGVDDERCEGSRCSRSFVLWWSSGSSLRSS